MKSIINKKGFSLVEAMAGTALLAITAMVTLHLADMLRDFHKKNSTHAAMTSLRENIINTILNQQAWDQTKAQNSALACNRVYPSTCASSQGGPINILNSNGAVLIDSLNPSSGFTRQGLPCLGFTPTGNARCPIRIQASWEAFCSGTLGCKFPQEVVTVTFEYVPGVNSSERNINYKSFNINQLARKNLSSQSSPSMICTNMGLVYIGENNWVYNGNGIPTLANGNGCVPISAFEGKRGPQGSSGSAGSRGPSGSKTPVNFSAPTSSPPSVCTSQPWICQQYQNILGRNPEQGGATYWSGEYQNCLNGGGNASSCQAIVSDNIEAAAAPELSGDTETIEKNAANWLAATGQTGARDECKSSTADCSNVDTSLINDYLEYCQQTGKCN